MSYNNKLPTRVPKGSPEGGQFTNTAEKTADELKTDLQQKVNDNPLIVKSASKQMIRDFVQRVQNGQVKDSEVCELGEITNKARADIERLTGQKLNAKRHVIDADAIRHIEYRHGENGKADKSMTDIRDYEEIVEVLKNYEHVDFARKANGDISYSHKYKDSQNRPAPHIVYAMENEKTMYLIEAVTDSKKGVLHIVSAYKN